MTLTLAELEQKSIDYRKTVLSIIKRAKAGHTGGSLSCVDILNVLYNHVLNVSQPTFPIQTATATFKAKAIRSKRFTRCWRIRAFTPLKPWRP